MLWTLVLMFLLPGGKMDYVTVDAEDKSQCVDMAKSLAEQADGMHWACISREGEVITETGE